MIIFILITIYILSTMGARWTSRQMVKNDHWMAESAGFEIWWIVPVVNTAGTIISLLDKDTYYKKGHKSKSQLWRKMINQDLLK